MKIRHLPAADRIALPWKNGGGVTREVAAFPPGADMGDFLWRVSIAEVAEAGPFSIFPGVDRILTVLAGTLDLGGLMVSAESDPFAFPGDVAIEGRPIDGPVTDGPVTDCNVMVRRGRVAAAVRRVGGLVRIETERALLLALETGNIGGIALASHDALLIEEAKGTIAIEGAALELVPL